MNNLLDYTPSTKEIYNNIYWAIRCWSRETEKESKMWWATELSKYKMEYRKIFNAANESFWSK